jgi:hypothetical protein
VAERGACRNCFIVSILSAFSSKLGYEEHIPGQTRDWNEELQTTRELPRKNLPERLLRERAIFKAGILNSVKLFYGCYKSGEVRILCAHSYI